MSRWLLRIACWALVLCAVAADYDDQAPSKQRRRRRRTGGAAPSPPPDNAALAKRVASMERKMKRVASMQKTMKKMRADIKKLKDQVGGDAPVKPKPKPEVKACMGKKEEAACWFPNPGKEKNMLKGYCTGKGRLWCKASKKDPPKPEPKPEVKACMGKKEKDACWFPNPGKEKIKLKGHCTGKDPLWCKISKKDPPKPEAKPEVKACVGKKAEDVCWRPNPEGKNMLKGSCTGAEPLWCKVVMPERPAKPEPKPRIKACVGKKDKDACWFPKPGGGKTMLKGNCTGKDPLWCKTANKDLPKPEAKPEIKACVGKKAEDVCWRPNPEGKNMLKGSCTGTEPLWCKVVMPERPAKPEPKPRTKACVGKKPKESCWFPDPKKATVKREGQCIGKATLWCGRSENFEAKVKACMGKKQKEACRFPSKKNLTKVKGTCTGTEPLICKRSLGGGSGKGI